MHVFDEIKKSLRNIFKNSFKEVYFRKKIKIAKIAPIFKIGKEDLLTNYRLMVVLPYFSKILEIIIYNRLHTYLDQNSISYNKQFGFRGGHSIVNPLI